MLLSNVSLIMKCLIGELLLRKVTALLSFPLPHLFEWLVLYVRLIPVTQFALFLLGFWWRMHLFRFSMVQFPIFPSCWFCVRKIVFEVELHDVRPVSCLAFCIYPCYPPILFCPVILTTLPEEEYVSIAALAMCTWILSLSLELLLKTVSCFPYCTEAAINEIWQFIVYFSVTCCSFLFFQLLWLQLLASLCVLKQCWQKFFTWELL